MLDPKFPPANLFTASDEAFALAALENNYERCLNRYHDAGNQAPKPKRNKENPKTEFYSNVPTKFTEGGIKYTDPNVKPNSSRGWNENGILKFNHYYEKIKADQKEHPQWIYLFYHEERQKIVNKGLQRANKFKPSIPAKRDLLTEPEDNWCPTLEEIEAMKKGASIEELKRKCQG